MRIAFTKKLRLSAANKERLDQINSIVEEYQDQDLVLTLRQLYYQLVSRDVIPNKQSEYSKLSTLLKEGRMAGIVDWDAIEDRLRSAEKPSSWDSPMNIMEAVIHSYAKHRMDGQPNYLEVWVEKDALSGVLSRVTEPYHIPICVNRGYSSASAMFQSYNRFRAALEKGQSIEILYLGDHDPSGIDMIRDVYDRPLEMLVSQAEEFMGRVWYGLMNGSKQKGEELIADLFEKWGENELAYDLNSWVVTGTEKQAKKEAIVGREECFDKDRALVLDRFKVTPIALTMDQITQYEPPPNPAKRTDPRSNDYTEKYGDSSWEVDALRPDVLNGLLSSAIEERLDKDAYDKIIQAEEKEKEVLSSAKEFVRKKLK